jgi:hypothetical protein
MWTTSLNLTDGNKETQFEEQTYHKMGTISQKKLGHIFQQGIVQIGMDEN